MNKIFFKLVSASLATVILSAQVSSASMVSRTPAQQGNPLLGVAVIFLGSYLSAQSDNNERQQRHEQSLKDREAASNFGAQLRKELGDRYNEVMNHIANQGSPDAISWIRYVGPAGEATYIKYAQNFQAK